jgi:Prokaryotic E2 family E
MSAIDALTDLSDSVRRAVGDLQRLFSVTATATGDGGAVVTVHDLPISERWRPSLIDLTFEVAYNYPHAPIYPYYTTPELARSNGGAAPAALQRVAWREAQWTQISLRATRWNPTVDTAVGAVLQVQRWFETA